MSSNGSRLLIPERILEAPRNSAGSMLDTGHQYQIIKAKIEQVVQQKKKKKGFPPTLYVFTILSLVGIVFRKI